MADAVSLRRFRPSDLDAVMELERSSFGAEAYPAELFAGYCRRCPELFLVATASGRIAGYSIACIRARGGAELVSIAVSPGLRRGGVGQALLRGTLRRLRLRQVPSLRLMVKTCNRSALRFYAAFGFRRMRVVRDYYEDGADGYLLTLPV